MKFSLIFILLIPFIIIFISFCVYVVCTIYTVCTNKLQYFFLKQSVLVSEIFILLNYDKILKDEPFTQVLFNILKLFQTEIEIISAEDIKEDTFNIMLLKIKEFTKKNNITIILKVKSKDLKRDRYGNEIFKEKEITISKGKLCSI